MLRFLRKLHILRVIWTHPLNKKRKLRSILVFINFQFIGRIKKSRIPVKWIHGLYFLAAPGETGMTINLYCSMSEPNEMLFMLHFLKSTDIFFDIGANAGSYSLLAAGISKCKVYSFEPVLETRQNLYENFELNKLSTKYIQSCALGSSLGKVQFTKTLDAVNHVARASEDFSTDWVELQTLDSYEGVSGVSLMKLDVEGYEMEILRGASRFLEIPTLKALIVETNGETEHYGSSDLDIAFYLQRYGFMPFDYDPIGRNLISLSKPNKFGNTIFVRNLNFVIDRVKAGPRIFVQANAF